MLWIMKYSFGYWRFVCFQIPKFSSENKKIRTLRNIVTIYIDKKASVFFRRQEYIVVNKKKNYRVRFDRYNKVFFFLNFHLEYFEKYPNWKSHLQRIIITFYTLLLKQIFLIRFYCLNHWDKELLYIKLLGIWCSSSY